jgi:hypothetical protein
MKCPHTAGCPLFALFRLKATQRTWMIRYCEGEFTSCARHQRSEAGDPVPLNLLPNGRLLRTESAPDQEEL